MAAEDAENTECGRPGLAIQSPLKGTIGPATVGYCVGPSGAGREWGTRMSKFLSSRFSAGSGVGLGVVEKELPEHCQLLPTFAVRA